MASDDNNKTLEQWQVKGAIDDYDTSLAKQLTTRFLIELATVKLWIAIGKFVAVAVALLIIGTLYQLFISLANIAGLK
jgi:hypothetical protein